MSEEIKKIVAPLLRRIDRYCRRKDMSESRFGRNACKNPSAVSRLRKGVYSTRMLSKIIDYLDAQA